MNTISAPKKKLAILISGSGSNLQAFIDAAHEQSFPATITVVISNKPDVKGLKRAAQAGIPTAVVDHKNFQDRNVFDQELIAVIDSYKPDAVILAGFMRVLGAEFVTHYSGRLFNIHPSLLPRFPGLHTHQRAIEAGDKEHGASVHFVVPELDAGPVIIQARVPVLANDNAESLAKRVLEQEHKIYPLAIKWFCENHLALSKDGAILKGKLLSPSGFQSHFQNLSG